jgi:hypothetical protein
MSADAFDSISGSETSAAAKTAAFEKGFMFAIPFPSAKEYIVAVPVGPEAGTSMLRMKGALSLDTLKLNFPDPSARVIWSTWGAEESFRVTVPDTAAPTAATPETVWAPVGDKTELPDPLPHPDVMLIAATAATRMFTNLLCI